MADGGWRMGGVSRSLIPLVFLLSSPRLQLEHQAPARSAGVQQSATSIPGSVVADAFWSQALGIRKRVMLWLPPSYGSQPSKRYPVAYYLHGHGGNETNWLEVGRLAPMLD